MNKAHLSINHCGNKKKGRVAIHFDGQHYTLQYFFSRVWVCFSFPSLPSHLTLVFLFVSECGRRGRGLVCCRWGLHCLVCVVLVVRACKRCQSSVVSRGLRRAQTDGLPQGVFGAQVWYLDSTLTDISFHWFYLRFASSSWKDARMPCRPGLYHGVGPRLLVIHIV